MIALTVAVRFIVEFDVPTTIIPETRAAVFVVKTTEFALDVVQTNVGDAPEVFAALEIHRASAYERKLAAVKNVSGFRLFGLPKRATIVFSESTRIRCPIGPHRNTPAIAVSVMLICGTDKVSSRSTTTTDGLTENICKLQFFFLILRSIYYIMSFGSPIVVLFVWRPHPCSLEHVSRISFYCVWRLSIIYKPKWHQIIHHR